MICGVDEAGKGPVMGPLVVAGVCFPDEEQISSLGVKDSKKISARRRNQYAKGIKQIASSYELLIIPATDIDDMRKVMTMNEIMVFSFHKVIKKLQPKLCYVDAADVNEQRFGRELSKRLPKTIEIISKHKADDIYPMVSAASILAKTTRDREIKKLEQQLQKRLKLPLGSGYPADPLTKKFLSTWVKKYKKLPPYTRKSWKTAKRFLDEINRRTLDDF